MRNPRGFPGAAPFQHRADAPPGSARSRRATIRGGAPVPESRSYRRRAIAASPILPCSDLTPKRGARHGGKLPERGRETTHSTATTTDGNSSRTPSPAVSTIRPPWIATIGSTAALPTERAAVVRPALALVV